MKYSDLNENAKINIINDYCYYLCLHIKDGYIDKDDVIKALGTELYETILKRIKFVRETETKENECPGYTMNHLFDDINFKKTIENFVKNTAYFKMLESDKILLNEGFQFQVIKTCMVSIDPIDSLFINNDLLSKSSLFNNAKTYNDLLEYEYLNYRFGSTKNV